MSNLFQQQLRKLINTISTEIATAYQHNLSEARAVTLALLAHHLQCKPHELFLLTAEKEMPYDTILRDVDLLKQGYPLQYVVGYVDFLDFRMQVQPGVFIPRPETEQLVKLIVQENEPASIAVDIGTGTGCIAIALKLLRPGLRLYAIDINPVALQVAQINAQSLQAEITFHETDILQWDPTSIISPEEALLVVSNPPYVLPSEQVYMSPQVLEHEPHDAIFASENDPIIFYKAILDKFQQHKAVFYFEINPLTLPQLIEHAKKLQFVFTHYKDFNNKNRFFKAFAPRYFVERK